MTNGWRRRWDRYSALSTRRSLANLRRSFANMEAYLHKPLGSFHSRGVWVESGWRSFQLGSFAERISSLTRNISETPATGCPSL